MIKYKFSIFIVLILLINCTPKIIVQELPRPNSEKYSYAQANAHRNEIFSLKKSNNQIDWQNPYRGYCVHISSNDRIFVKEEYGKSYKEMSFAEFSKFAETVFPFWGNPLGVLLTSEIDPKKSKVFSKIMDILFVPSIQIYYAK